MRQRPRRIKVYRIDEQGDRVHCWFESLDDMGRPVYVENLSKASPLNEKSISRALTALSKERSILKVTVI